MLPAIHSSAHHIVEPMDHAISHRHLRITYSSMKHSDKTFMGMTSSGKNAEDVIEMCKILFGEKFIDSHAVVTGNINGNSPLVWDQTMLSALRVFSAHNQPVLCSPFVLGGANTPASVAPTVAQVNAEALSALAIHSGYPKRSSCDLWSLFSYCINAVWCSNGWNSRNLSNEFYDWSNGKHYKVPWRSSNTLGGSKVFDAQSGYESASTMMAVLLSGANYIWHSAGWNEAGMHCSMAKFVVDAEQCEMGYRMAEGVRWDDFEEGSSCD